MKTSTGKQLEQECADLRRQLADALHTRDTAHHWWARQCAQLQAKVTAAEGVARNWQARRGIYEWDGTPAGAAAQLTKAMEEA